MSASTQYPQLAPHDPNGTRLRTLPVTIDAGDSLLETTTLVPVDASNNEIEGGDLTVEIVSIGLISETASGDVWGVNFRLHGGADRIGETPLPLIRLRPYLAAQPDEPAYDQTYRVEIKNT